MWNLIGELLLASSPVPQWLVEFGRQIEHMRSPR